MYSIFWIKEEFAEHYFYKCDILYRFFKSYQMNQERGDLSGQFRYITNKFPTTMISHIITHQRYQTSMQTDSNQLKIKSKLHGLTLHIHEKHIKFYCDSLHDAEALLFPALRLFHPFLFIIGDRFQDFGWISPVTTKIRQPKEEQILYSYL